MSNLSLAIFIGTWDALKWIFEIKIEKLHIFALFWVRPKGDIYMKGQHRVLLLLPKTATDVAKNFRSYKGRSQLSHPGSQPLKCAWKPPGGGEVCEKRPKKGVKNHVFSVFEKTMVVMENLFLYDLRKCWKISFFIYKILIEGFLRKKVKGE